MSFEPKFPLKLVEIGGDGKFTCFTKLMNEFSYLYSTVLSGLFSSSTGHKHTGAVNDGAQLGASSIADGSITTAKFEPTAKCPLATLANKATLSENCEGNSATATTVKWSGVIEKPVFADIPLDYVTEQLLGVNGYTKWKSGKIEQWGQGIFTGGWDLTTFPTLFIASCFAVVVSVREPSDDGSALATTVPTLRKIGLTTFEMGLSGGNTWRYTWTAIGK